MSLKTNMVRKIFNQNKGELYECEACGYRYVEKDWAEKCELWCNEHKTCNIGIIAHGYPPDSDNAKQ